MDKKQKPRVDKLKNIKKVAQVVIKDPLKTDRQIEEETGVTKSVVNRAKQELGHTGAKSQFILDVIEKDKAIITRGLEIIAEKLNDPTQVYAMKASEVSNVIKENTARYTLFRGEITDAEGGMKEAALSDSQTKALDSLLSLYNRNGL